VLWKPWEEEEENGDKAKVVDSRRQSASATEASLEENLSHAQPATVTGTFGIIFGNLFCASPMLDPHKSRRMPKARPDYMQMTSRNTPV
jgi:hypothetical protein